MEKSEIEEATDTHYRMVKRLIGKKQGKFWKRLYKTGDYFLGVQDSDYIRDFHPLGEDNKFTAYVRFWRNLRDDLEQCHSLEDINDHFEYASFTHSADAQIDYDSMTIQGHPDDPEFPITAVFWLDDGEKIDVIFHSLYVSPSLFYRDNGDGSCDVVYID